MSLPANSADGTDPLAIICGGGTIPFLVADAAIRKGRRVVLFAMRGWADPAAVARYPNHWISIGELGRLQRLAEREGCRDVVMIGTLRRPALTQIWLDFTAVRMLPRLIRSFRGGDNYLLTGVASTLEYLGFRVLGAHEVAPEILVPEGTLGRHRPSPRDLADIDRGMKLLAATGPFDIGQAVVVANQHVLAVEAIEGTDLMLTRVADLRRQKRIVQPWRTGVLVKAPKPSQDLRLDLPTIGPRTVELATAAGLAGIAVEAGATVTVELDVMVRAADHAGLFVFGSKRGRAGT